MAVVTRSVTASGADGVSASFAPQVAGDLFAAEALDYAAPCFIHTDGLVYMSLRGGSEPKVDGFTPASYAAGDAVTLVGPGAKLRYGSGLTPSADLFVGVAKGTLDNAAGGNATVAVARVLHGGTTIRVLRFA